MTTSFKSPSEIYSSHVLTTRLSSDELIQAINKIYASLQALEVCKKLDAAAAEKSKVHVRLKQAFVRNDKICIAGDK
jgi:predicted transcriptional regulator